MLQKFDKIFLSNIQKNINEAWDEDLLVICTIVIKIGFGVVSVTRYKIQIATPSIKLWPSLQMLRNKKKLQFSKKPNMPMLHN